MPDAAPSTKTDANLERRRLTSLINSMADGVIAIDENSNVAVYNGAALNILNINTTITGQPISNILKLIGKENQPLNTLELIKAQKTAFSSRDYAITYPDGSVIKLYLSIAPVHQGYGDDNTQGYVLILRDITREKSLEEERNEFISVASHELRTPVAIAEGNVSNARLIVKKGGDPKLIDQALEQAYDQVIFLSSLINDLATLSRAEGGKLKPEVNEINVHDLIEELTNAYGGGAESKGLKLLTDIDPHLEILKSSQLYIHEILQNFITNSIKYTETGHVLIGARQNNNGVDFWVEDTGIGISKTDQEKVFNKFFRSEDYRTRQNKGTGLGLYVTLKLAKLIGADIRLQSELNKGTRFSLYVPNQT
jgi:PAS domain S-box-containing protein